MFKTLVCSRYVRVIKHPTILPSYHHPTTMDSEFYEKWFKPLFHKMAVLDYAARKSLTLNSEQAAFYKDLKNTLPYLSTSFTNENEDEDSNKSTNYATMDLDELLNEEDEDNTLEKRYDEEQEENFFDAYNEEDQKKILTVDQMSSITLDSIRSTNWLPISVVSKNDDTTECIEDDDDDLCTPTENISSVTTTTTELIAV